MLHLSDSKHLPRIWRACPRELGVGIDNVLTVFRRRFARLLARLLYGFIGLFLMQAIGRAINGDHGFDRLLGHFPFRLKSRNLAPLLFAEELVEIDQDQ